MKIKQFDIWIADLNPQLGSEPGKVRPVLIIQTDFLNKVHSSTIVCPLTTNIQLKSNILRVHIKAGTGQIQNDCDILIDQVRAIDNRRFIKRIGFLPEYLYSVVKDNLKIVMDLN